MAKIPEKVGKYKILSQIGKGGMGVVYSAQHPTLKRKVILKKLTVRDKEFRERFRLEADMMMDLRSDYVVDMYDHFREGSSWYIAMEYIEGISLEELIARGEPLDMALVIYIMLCTARALEYIHERGIVHRDIKPSNIYISRSGDVKLGDFGIASSSGRDVKITDSGAAMGTPAYMAPEQFDDTSTVGRKADLFSFGVTLYEALTGRKPFHSESYTALKKEIRRGRFKSPAVHREKVPLFLRWIIRRCLFVTPRLRPSGISSIGKRLESELGRRSIPQLREQLSRSIEGSNKKKRSAALTQPIKIAGASWKIKLFPPVAIGSLILILSLFAWSYLSGRYGILQMSVLPANEMSSYTLYPHNSDSLQKGRFDKSGRKRLYLKEGSYRISVESGSSLSWRSFYISPVKKGNEPLNLTILSTPYERLPMILDLVVRDRFSGDDLTENTQIHMKRADEWIPLSPEMRNSLKTGSSIELKFSHELYDDETYSLTADHHQTLLDLHVLLSPLPARLEISSAKGAEILINGKREYFSPDTLGFENLSLSSQEGTEIEILPGTYTITLRNPHGEITREIELHSGEKYIFP